MKKRSKIILICAIVVLILAIALSVILYRQYVSNHATVTIKGHSVTVELARTPEELYKGLSGRDSLGKNQGMLFVFPDKHYQTFWMKDMKIPLDIIWIDGDKVIDITKNAPVPIDPDKPAIYQSISEVNYVLEVNAGYADSNNVKVGDEVGIKY